MRTFVFVAATVTATFFTAVLAVADDAGLQVEVDPRTGAYSLPAPGRLPDTAPRTVLDDDVVITPGRSAAGGFKATRRDMLLLQTPPRSAVDGASPPPAQ